MHLYPSLFATSIHASFPARLSRVVYNHMFTTSPNNIDLLNKGGSMKAPASTNISCNTGKWLSRHMQSFDLPKA